VHRYLKPLMERVEKGDIDPSFVITDRLDLAEGAKGYETFDAQNGCIKVVLRP
jgi:threonine dehydrogenase-like Zn-dependent dehydrogenase